MTALGNDGKVARKLDAFLLFALATATGCAGSEMPPPDVEFTPAPANARGAIIAPAGTLPTAPSQMMTAPGATSPTADQPTSTAPAMQPPAAPSMPAPTTGTAGATAPDVSTPPTTATAGAGGSNAMPPAMMAGSAAEPMMPEQPATAAATSLAVTLTTVTQGGKYAPINVGAIWIEDSSGKWVDTLEYWDSLINARWLTAYSKAGGVSYDGFFTQAPPDVVASATLKTHKTHTSKWDFKDSKGTVVPDGTYRVVVELTEASATGKTAKFEFTKGMGAMVVPTTDDQYYKDVKLELK